VSAANANRAFPRGPLLGAGALVAAALLATGVARLTGHANDEPTGATLSARDMYFHDRPDGGIAVVDAANGLEVIALAPGSDGFLRATLRGLARERKRHELGAEEPFRLTAWADGRLTLQDRSTGRFVDLGAFGPTNAQAFARLLPPDGRIVP
jgi:putative photosynthetic complex assembly protein